ncbi:MAG: Lrp/AsnC family transcriptional regulator [Halanaerobiaceae bacterium]
MIDDLDMKLIEELSYDSRISFAELGRKFNLSRVYIRERINNLVEKGIIEHFTVVINPAKLGKNLSVFFDIEVKPNSLYTIAEELSSEDAVTNIYLTTGSSTLYVNALLEGHDELEIFIRDILYSKKDIMKVHTNIMLKEFKNSNKEYCP